MLLPQFYVDDIIKTALQEDINYLDTTTDLMIPATARSTARFMAKAEGVVCGLVFSDNHVYYLIFYL